ncbi:MAG: amidohydrolase family protein [Candidatus Rokubacteria bacterium]|nr:amidohydrolase family protein [Candidatus Rokubacteria bacterium]
MASSLVRGRYVVCGAEGGAMRVVADGAVYEENGTIIAVGPHAELAAQHQPDRVLGSPDHVVLPGFVNSHHHVGLTPFQLGSPDHPLELWFASRMAARDVDPYLDTLYSAFEMLESGITTVQHLHGVRTAPASRVAAIAERILQAYADIGMRVSYSYALRDQNRLVYEADQDFVRRLPPALAPEIASYLEAQAIPLTDHIGLFADLWERHERNTNARVRIQLAPANLHWCSDEALDAIGDAAARHRVGMHMHLVETAFQRVYARRRTGTTALRHLAAHGLLGPALTLGHGTWLTEADIALTAETGTMLCHNASSNLRLRSGIAPLNHVAARGIRVALGLDEAGINDDRDMFQEMRLVLRLHRVPGMDDAVPTCAQVFEMATAGGAATTPFADRIGAIAPGRAADLVLLPWRSVAHPYLDPDTAPVDAVVHRGRAGAVDTVMVAGEIVLEGGRFTRIDREAALEELARSLRAPLRPEEERRRRLAREVFPHVRRFYDGWLDDLPADPFYTQSSRR